LLSLSACWAHSALSPPRVASLTVQSSEALPVRRADALAAARSVAEMQSHSTPRHARSIWPHHPRPPSYAPPSLHPTPSHRIASSAHAHAHAHTPPHSRKVAFVDLNRLL
jgi:hypothetical protein